MTDPLSLLAFVALVIIFGAKLSFRTVSALTSRRGAK
jgi:hypothetical protein